MLPDVPRCAAAEKPRTTGNRMQSRSEGGKRGITIPAMLSNQCINVTNASGGNGESTVSDREDPKAITVLWLSAVAIAGTVERDGGADAVEPRIGFSPPK